MLNLRDKIVDVLSGVSRTSIYLFLLLAARGVENISILSLSC
jgi:hypothetical protein